MKKILVSILVVFLLCGCSSVTKVDGTKAHEMYLEGAILLDVRTMDEYMEYHLENSILIPVDNINEETVTSKITNKETKIIVYCRSGNRSAVAAKKLIDLGYTNVYNLDGGLINWGFELVEITED